MSTAQPITILDVAYDVLTRSEGPLSPEQIALIARVEGFDVSGWDIKAEIEADIDYMRDLSPFIEVGKEQYGLLLLPSPSAELPVSFAVLRPVVMVVAMLLVLMLVFLAAAYKRPSIGSEKTARSQPPAAQAMPQPSNLSWWSANAMNQISAQTQDVARQYLSNYYNTCGPTVVAMLTTYYRAQSAKTEGRVTPADVIRDARNELGYFISPYNSGLLEFRNLRDLFGLYGLAQVYPQGSSDWISFDALLKRVRQGMPAVAGMRYGYQGDWQYLPIGGSGIYDHFVIVIAAFQENGKDYFWVYNPHPGKYLYEDRDAVPTKMSFEQFRQSWQLNDDSENADYGPAVFYRLES